MIFDNGKTADQIRLIKPETDNDYERDIHMAACIISANNYGEARYLTHYSSGNSAWKIGDKTAVFQRRNGVIVFN
jgi:hypothetical protein